jgi:predicted transcriptional regulator
MVGEAVRSFLHDCIDSFESLEVLLLLYDERTAWTADELCRRFKIRAPVIDDALASLVRARLVNTTEQNVLTSYRYAADEDLVRDALIASLERTYRDEPIQVMQLMSANAMERLRNGAIRAFADAFVFRKDKGRG